MCVRATQFLEYSGQKTRVPQDMRQRSPNDLAVVAALETCNQQLQQQQY